MSIFDYKRRESSRVDIGNTPLGSDFPIRIQSMTSTSTMDTDASVAQAERIVDAGGEYVRLTAQGVREANNLAKISAKLRADGYEVPLVADIHFNPKAAEAAAAIVEKVRINPGNFVDPGRTFVKLEFTDEEYARELQRIEERLIPFIEICRRHNTAIRIGVNHGSLSDRIMSRYGDTPEGMTESAMEFLRVFVKHDFSNVVISIKASNTVVMVTTVRLLVKAMEAEGMKFPLHLGVTEAGNGEDGRVKSAVGIGALLHQGIGDTIRVSLSEEPEAEIPVARKLVGHIAGLADAPETQGSLYPGYDPIRPARRPTEAISGIGGTNLPKATGVDPIDAALFATIDADMPHDALIEAANAARGKILLVVSKAGNRVASIRSALHALTAAGIHNPAIPHLSYNGVAPDDVTIFAAADFGALLLDGLHDGISLEADTLSAEQIRSLSLAILQAARLRFSHTEYISCPGCGRTLFDLQSTVNRIKAATSHLPNLKIGVMGCIVNGPGEMADADYGYIGAAAGKVSLYRGKQCIERNIPSDEALPHLIALLEADGVWQQPDNHA